YKQGYCGTASDRIRVITKYCGPVGPTCPTVTVTGPDAVCADIEQVFTAAVQNASNNMTFAYTWRVPAGWRIVRGQGSNSITVLPGNTQGQVIVNMVDSRCKDNDDDNDDDNDNDDDEDSDYCDDDEDRDGKGDHDHNKDGKGDKCDDDNHDHDNKDKKSKSNYCNDDNDRDGKKDHDHDHDGKGDKCDDNDHKADTKNGSKGDKKYRTASTIPGNIAYTSNSTATYGNKKKSNYSKDDKDRDGKGDHDHDHNGKGDDCDDDDHDSKDKNKKDKSNYCNEDNDKDGKKDHDHDHDGKGDKCDDDNHHGDDKDNDGNCDDDDDEEDNKECCSAAGAKTVTIKENCGTTPTCPTLVVSVAGPDTVCAFQDEPVTFTANVTGTTDMTTFVWAVPGDWEILEGQGSASIQVQVGSESGQVKVSVANACGTKASNTLDVFADENCGSLTPLPVELISFEGEATKSGVLLEWATATEKNNERFEVERSADGVTFAKIAEVKGNGTTSVKRTYSLRDAKAIRGTHYYRLKQVDLDGTSEYSKMIVVENAAAAAAGLVVAPNPANGQFTIAIDNADAAQLQILDMNGKLLHSQSLSQGARELNFNTASLGMNSGLYLISIKSAAGASHAKLVVR
ncbi:MAG TPA: T9SS type A sorting domain-containing protein, partial [Nitrosospira sp.]|nr:T9SS type A sorting domain-containing protein [Nitrosospira sp.]